MITCGSQAMAELLLLALLPIANDRIRGAASEKEYEDTLRRRYDLRTCARPWRCLRQRRMRDHLRDVFQVNVSGSVCTCNRFIYCW